MNLIALLLLRIAELEALVVALLTRRRRSPSEETRAKISERLMGHSVSDKTRTRMSEAKRGRKLSAEHRRRISEGKQRARKDEPSIPPTSE